MKFSGQSIIWVGQAQYWKLGEGYFKTGNYETAKYAYNNALRIYAQNYMMDKDHFYPLIGQCLNKLARCYEELGKNSLARKYHDSAQEFSHQHLQNRVTAASLADILNGLDSP